MAKARGDFAERHQHKAALVHVRMRQGQIRAFDDALAVEEQVEVEGARPPVNTALPLVVFFCGEQGGEQRLGSERGFYGKDGVEEIRLLDRSLRRGFVGMGDLRKMRTGESGDFS